MRVIDRAWIRCREVRRLIPRRERHLLCDGFTHGMPYTLATFGVSQMADAFTVMLGSSV